MRLTTMASVLTGVGAAALVARKIWKDRTPSGPICYQPDTYVNLPHDFETYRSALYDYVGAVYGRSSGVTKDGCHTPAERQLVEVEFGRLGSWDEIPDFLSKVRKIFLEHHRTGAPEVEAVCDRAKDRFVRVALSTQKGQETLIIGGLHFCGENLVGLFPLQSELRMAAYPENWDIYLEGVGTADDLDAGELAYFQRVAQVNGIKIKDPVVSIQSAEVIAEMKTRHGYTSMDLAVAEMWEGAGMLRKMSRVPLGSPLQLDELAFWQTNLQKTAILYDVNSDALRENLERSRTPPQGEETSHFMIRIWEKYGQMTQQLADISNEFTAIRIRELAEKSPKTNRVAIVGQAHVDAIKRGLAPAQ